MVKALTKNTVSSALKGSKYQREICYAAATGDSDLLVRNVNNGVDPTACLYDGRTALHIAARNGNLKVWNCAFQEMEEGKGTHFGESGGGGGGGCKSGTCCCKVSAAVDGCSAHGNLQIAEFLIETGANVNAEDSNGKTPLMDAIMGGHQLMAQLIKFNRGTLGKRMKASLDYCRGLV